MYPKCGRPSLSKYSLASSMRTRSFRWLRYTPISTSRCPYSQLWTSSSLLMSSRNAWDGPTVMISSRRIPCCDSRWTASTYHATFAINLPIWPSRCALSSRSHRQQPNKCRNDIPKGREGRLRRAVEFECGHGLPVRSSRRRFEDDCDIAEGQIGEEIHQDEYF